MSQSKENNRTKLTKSMVLLELMSISIIVRFVSKLPSGPKLKTKREENIQLVVGAKLKDQFKSTTARHAERSFTFTRIKETTAASAQNN